MASWAGVTLMPPGPSVGPLVVFLACGLRYVQSRGQQTGGLVGYLPQQTSGAAPVKPGAEMNILIVCGHKRIESTVEELLTLYDLPDTDYFLACMRAGEVYTGCGEQDYQVYPQVETDRKSGSEEAPVGDERVVNESVKDYDERHRDRKVTRSPSLTRRWPS
jgi:hypothetical protein